MYCLNKMAWALLNPALLGLVSAVFCWALSGRRFFRVLCLLSLVWLWLWCTPLMTILVGVTLERGSASKTSDGRYYMREASGYPTCDAIVDLGGGTGAVTNFYSGVFLSAAADRAYFCSELWKKGKAPIVIPSGAGCTISDGRFLKDLGVPESAIVVEDRARNTEENAKCVSRLLKQRSRGAAEGARPRILLVTSAWHMKRSRLMFEKYAPDVTVVPAPCDFECFMGKVSVGWTYLIPNFEAAGRNIVYVHEWLGYLWYKWIRN